MNVRITAAPDSCFPCAPTFSNSRWAPRIVLERCWTRHTLNPGDSPANTAGAVPDGHR
jgi:hypothetical protein